MPDELLLAIKCTAAITLSNCIVQLHDPQDKIKTTVVRCLHRDLAFQMGARVYIEIIVLGLSFITKKRSVYSSFDINPGLRSKTQASILATYRYMSMTN